MGEWWNKIINKTKNLMFQTQKGYNWLDPSILNELLYHLANDIPSSKLGHYKQIAAKLKDPKSASSHVYPYHHFWWIIKL